MIRGGVQIHQVDRFAVAYFAGFRQLLAAIFLLPYHGRTTALHYMVVAFEAAHSGATHVHRIALKTLSVL